MALETSEQQKIERKVEDRENVDIAFNDEDLITDLHQMVELLVEKCSWIRNISIENKKEEKERFMAKREAGEKYRPEFSFQDFPYSEEKLLDLLDQCISAAKEVKQDELDRYGAEEITAEQMTEFYQDIFREFKLYVKLAANIENEENWKKYSEKIWPMVDKDEMKDSEGAMRQLEPQEHDKDLDSFDLKEMFEDEVDRLGMEYDVEIREVSGCYNIPEEKTVVVADGAEGEKRYYSEAEAKMLTVHELFHSVRAYNGYRASENDLPPILAIHTPFYDQTEEGGALYREKRTGAAYPVKDFDHHLRLITAYKLSETDDSREEFDRIVDEVVELGADEERVFELLARNREVLRHHIYRSGYREWRDLEEDEIWPLLIGKINHDYAEVFKEEVEANGMLQEPEVGAEKLFDFTFKDSE